MLKSNNTKNTTWNPELLLPLAAEKPGRCVLVVRMQCIVVVKSLVFELLQRILLPELEEGVELPMLMDQKCLLY